MKKLTFLALICLFVMGNTALSQSFEFRHANGGAKISDTLFIDVDSEVPDPITTLMERHIDIKNLANVSVKAQIVGDYLSDFEGGFVSYCYGNCPEVGSPTNEFTLLADTLLKGFFIDFRIPNVGKFYFSLKIENTQDNEDYEEIVVAFERNNSSEIKLAEKPAVKADIYPNPASDNIKIKYDLGGTFSANSQLIIRNLVGAVVKTIPLKPTEKELMASVSDLSSGIYFYSLSIDGVIQNTKKLIIKK